MEGSLYRGVNDPLFYNCEGPDPNNHGMDLKVKFVGVRVHGSEPKLIT